MHAWFGGMIEFVRRYVVAEQVATIVSEPQLFRLRMPIEPYRVSYAANISNPVPSSFRRVMEA